MVLGTTREEENRREEKAEEKRRQKKVMLVRVDSPGSLLSDSVRDESFHSFCPRITDALLLLLPPLFCSN